MVLTRTAHAASAALARPSAHAERIILVSNRGPVTHQIDDAGRIRRADADGGVAIALANVARNQPVTWIAGACTMADRVVAITGRPLSIGDESYLRLVNISESVYNAYYSCFCNPVLWFTQHGLARSLRDRGANVLRTWREGYIPANRLFAKAVLDELDESGDGTPVMLHDYHLYLAPRLIRDQRPGALLQQFIHIPWPGPDAWRVLPAPIVRQMCDGLLANDSLVFQTEESVEGFMATCRAYLGSAAQVYRDRGKVVYAGTTTALWSNPISVDAWELREFAASQPVQRYRAKLPASEMTIVRVDRLDPSKNVERGFEAFENLLERRPDLHGRVRFLAYLVPSRTGIPEYDDYAQSVFNKIDAINSRFGTEDWQPVTLYYQQNRAEAFAGLQRYDVLLVNSVADGMNLVSKEGPVVNQRNGVLVLSTAAGSYEELRYGALCVDPLNIEATSRALEAALEMPPDERARRATLLTQAIESHQLSDWLRHQTNDLSLTRYLRETPAAGF
jgi:trehalose 6-phosphate synthase